MKDVRSCGPPRPDPGAAGVCLTCGDALDPRGLTCRCTGHPLLTKSIECGKYNDVGGARPLAEEDSP